MANNKNRPNHIEDALCTMGEGQWFGWSDSKNKVYANLIVHSKIWNKDYTGNIFEDGMIDNPTTKPSEEEVNAKLKELQDEWDSNNA